MKWRRKQTKKYKRWRENDCYYCTNILVTTANVKNITDFIWQLLPIRCFYILWYYWMWIEMRKTIKFPNRIQLHGKTLEYVSYTKAAEQRVSKERWCWILTDRRLRECVLLKDNELSQQLTSGTSICERVCRSKEDILSKFCDYINNWLNVCETLTWYRLYCNFFIIWVIFKR